MQSVGARVSDVTVQDAAEPRTIARGSTFSENGYGVLEAVDGPYDVVATSSIEDPQSAAVYFNDGQHQPHRVQLVGAAKDLNWRPNTRLRRVARSFRVPLRATRRVTPLPGTSLQLSWTRRGGFDLQALRYVWTDRARFRTISILAPGSQPDLIVRDARSPIVVGRFAERPGERRLRVFDVYPGAAPVDLPAPALADAATLTTNEVGDVAYRDGSSLVVLVRQAAGAAAPFVSLSVPAGAGTVPVLALNAAFYTDPNGALRSLQLR